MAGIEVEQRVSLLGWHPRWMPLLSASVIVFPLSVAARDDTRRTPILLGVAAVLMSLLAMRLMLGSWEKRQRIERRGAIGYDIGQLDVGLLVQTNRLVGSVEPTTLKRLDERGGGNVPLLLAVTREGVAFTPTRIGRQVGFPTFPLPWRLIRRVGLSPMLLGFGAWAVEFEFHNGSVIRGDVLRGRAFGGATRTASSGG